MRGCGASEGWGVVLQIARQSGRHDDTVGRMVGRRSEWVAGPSRIEWESLLASGKGSLDCLHMARRDAVTQLYRLKDEGVGRYAGRGSTARRVR